MHDYFGYRKHFWVDAMASFIKVVRGTTSFSEAGIAYVGNLSVFITSLLGGRLDSEIGERDVLATKRGPKMKA